MSFNSGASSGRGGYAPRRGRGGGSRPFVKRQEPTRPDINKHPLGELLVLLRNSNLETLRNDPLYLPGISNCQYVASYNWLGDKTATILVPGQPPQWTPPKVSQKLPEDNGDYYRDPNAARYPEYPIAPAVQAIIDMTDDTLADTEVFACGSTLGNLLRFARGIDKAFRFNVEVVGDTVFLIRKENDPKELIEGVRGFGHSFPEAYTTWQKEVKGSETHQRMVQYDLGGIHCLVRFECDGYFDDTPKAATTKKPDSPTSSPLEHLLGALQGTTISPSHPTTATPLTIKHTGTRIPQTSIFDLKTRSGKHHKLINMDDIDPQLWIKQIPNFIVAYHDGAGLFQDIQIQDVRSRIALWEKDNKQAIDKLVVLLRKIIEAAKVDDTGLLEVYCPGAERLEIRRQFGEGAHALPVTLSEEWTMRSEGGGRLPLDDEDTGFGAWPGDEDGYGGGWGSDDDSDGEGKDFTACSAVDCGYCGRCTY
ncbi:hypothetical protein N0V94_000707 [Neodidymelliopsis sp. IMI 364377]|nr:hypothetical protein N0V94_000707 [Neodidymelliopsis sp. IMI 364377]